MSLTITKPANNLETITHERRKQPLCSCIDSALQLFFQDLNGHQPPHDLYQMVIDEVELPLLKAVMKHVCDNQSKAAELLGINRSTLRKKLKKHGLNQ